MTGNICLSGGAEGADYVWGEGAKRVGHDLIHYSFGDHRPFARKNLLVLSSQQLLEADPYLVKAAPKLKKYYRSGRDPEDPANGTPNLLRRNWWQVRDTERVYAISTIKDGIVQGGTAWAVQMFLDREGGFAHECECYVYDQETKHWHFWHGPGGWVRTNDLPPPHGRYTGIGTRKLNPEGRAAIRALMEKCK